MIEIKGQLQLFMWSIEKSISLYKAIRLCIVLRLIRSEFYIIDEVVSECMGKVSEILPINAHIQHVERILMVKMRNVGDFATNHLAIIHSLCTEPVRIVI